MVCRSVFVDGDKDVLVSQHRRDSEKGGKEVGDDIKRVVQVDGDKVLVVI